MNGAEREWLTTGQAAKLCCVKPDTILKWIKRGRLQAERTPGGHYRIPAGELEPLALTPRRPTPAPDRGRASAQPLRCWEYLGIGGVTPDECQECIVFRSRASWCFQMVERAREMGHSRHFCRESCENCTYFHRVRGMATSVLVVSADQAFREHLLAEEHEGVRIRFARNGYEASAVIQDFRPAFIVIDHELLQAESALLDLVANDSRLSGVRVIIAATTGKGARVRSTLERDIVVGVLEKPFGPEGIASVVEAFPVEVLSAEAESS